MLHFSEATFFPTFKINTTAAATTCRETCTPCIQLGNLISLERKKILLHDFIMSTIRLNVVKQFCCYFLRTQNLFPRAIYPLQPLLPVYLTTWLRCKKIFNFFNMNSRPLSLLFELHKKGHCLRILAPSVQCLCS